MPLFQIALTRVYGSTILRAHSEILPRHLHVSLTEFTASPMLSADELEDLPWSESKEEEEKSVEELVQIKRAVLKGVITYTCEYEGAFPQTPAETQKRLEDYGITENSYFEEIFRAVLRCGPREVAWQAALAIRILREVTELFLKEPNVVRVNPPLAIYADLHGQYSDLWRWLNVNGWPARTRSLFMGDYVDRGRHCTEVYLLLALLKILYPENVTLLRGNHEDGQVNRTYSFFAEVEARFADRAKEVFEAFEDCFAAMPMTGLVGGRVLCLHGGLTPRLPSLADIEAVSRPTSRHLTKDEDFIGILWSDPVDVRNFQPNVARDTCGHGIGYEFGPPQIHKFCKENEVCLSSPCQDPPFCSAEFHPPRTPTPDARLRALLEPARHTLLRPRLPPGRRRLQFGGIDADRRGGQDAHRPSLAGWNRQEAEEEAGQGSQVLRHSSDAGRQQRVGEEVHLYLIRIVYREEIKSFDIYCFISRFFYLPCVILIMPLCSSSFQWQLRLRSFLSLILHHFLTMSFRFWFHSTKRGWGR